jgi:hypothetical protein
MAEQGSYPLNGRTLQGTDTVTGVVTNQTADIPLSILATFILTTIGAGTISGPTTSRPNPPGFVGQSYFDITLGYTVWVKTINPSVWVDAAGVPV